MPARRTTGHIYQLKVTLRDSHPPIWRRLQVPSNVTLYRLHQILQVAMGWTDSHLHEWVGEDFDPARFSVDEVNEQLRDSK